MGFFDKKTYVCERCGKEFQKRINLNGNICDECCAKEEMETRKFEEAVEGYIQYGKSISREPYTKAEKEKIIEHRDRLLQKFRHDSGITRAELANASNNYKQLTDEQAADVLIRAARSSVSSTVGAVYSERFFCPTHYAGTIVDAEDVFAVGMKTYLNADIGLQEAILCVLFTNDPYMPVFPVMYAGELGFFELIKSKKGHRETAAAFESMCPNLTYPVTDIKQLKKLIKEEKTVKGNLDSKFMLAQLNDASLECGLFSVKKLHAELFPESTKMLDEIGYISSREVNAILKMDKMFNRNYWNKQLQRLSGK